MTAKAFLVLFAQVFFIQTITAQYINIGNQIPLSSGCGCGSNGYSNGAVASGGNFAIFTTSPISPAGVSLYSENLIEGTLNINGALPFLSAVALQGTMPTSGQGSVLYTCGCPSNVGMNQVPESVAGGVYF